MKPIFWRKEKKNIKCPKEIFHEKEMDISKAWQGQRDKTSFFQQCLSGHVVSVIYIYVILSVHLLLLLPLGHVCKRPLVLGPFVNIKFGQINSFRTQSWTFQKSIQQ